MTWYKHHACSSCGACSFMGMASTMQIMAEALGLMLPAIGHVSPEAADGGPIALIEEDDLIEIDIPARILRMIRVRGEKKPPEAVVS